MSTSYRGDLMPHEMHDVMVARSVSAHFLHMGRLQQGVRNLLVFQQLMHSSGSPNSAR